MRDVSRCPAKNRPLMLACAAAAIVGALAAGGVSGHGVGEASTPPLPERLSEAGLFVAGSITEIRPELLAFSPQYPLWTDGARKRRWIEVPPGTSIDASRPQVWSFPPGTRLWKEFSFGRPVETRLIERLGDGSWRFASYVWNEDGSDAMLAPPDGYPALVFEAAPGGRYSIPSEYDCRACHEGGPTPVLGFSALQLSPDRDPLAPHAEPADPRDADLRMLAARGWLENLPAKLLEQPPRIVAASPEERAVLGYLHGNCGHCHSDPQETDAAVPVGVRLAHDVTDPESTARVRRSLIGAASRYRPAGGAGEMVLVAPGHADSSVLVARMRSRDPRTQMPPLGTALPDLESLALIERWINQTLPQTQEIQP